MAGEMSDDNRMTPLHDRHVALGARMIPFAGWMMPVQYSGIIEEHNLVRTKAGLFDLGHMGQVDVTGPDALAFLQEITTNDVAKLEPGGAQYSMLPTPSGGVIDDIFIYRHHEGPGYFVCVNASNRERDVAWMHEQRAAHPELDVTVEDISDATGMIAIQGPSAVEITQTLTDADLSQTTRNSWIKANVAGIELMLARTGYTGEDGFEISVRAEHATALADALVAMEEVQPIGLGARDSLRLEAGLPLYGHDLSPETDPVSADLTFAISKARREEGGFPGAERILALLAEGTPRRRVGLALDGRMAAREGATIMSGNESVGVVTSGGFSPSLQHPIAMGYVDAAHAEPGTTLEIEMRGKLLPATVVPMPFVPHRYHRKGDRP